MVHGLMKSQLLVPTLSCVVMVVVSGCSREQTGDRAEPLGDGVAAAVASIHSEDYLRKLGVIAHDSMGGRDTPSPGLEMTAAWIAGEFGRIGLAPGGDDGSFVQRYPIDGERSAPNVAGILEGSDLDLKEEYVVFSAHMDHIGIGPPNAEGDSINNGADDDGSGTTAILEIAEAFASLDTKPRRSVIFLLVSGEEQGLLGSAYFADNPPVPVERMVADLNADMVGRNWTDTIAAIGMEQSDLGETLRLVNAAHPELGMTAIDDIWPEEGFYFRSDHYNFAKKGVPVLFFFNGTHEDYHGRDDEVDRIDAEKAVRVSRLIFYLGYELANRLERPIWDPESLRQVATDR
jgi:Zn-dependent M28 family amino/carboxypeptidase